MIASFRDPQTELGPGDIVIVGAGLAGLFTALKLAPLPVTIVAAAPLGEGASSVWAQGGIAAAVGEGDTPEAHAARHHRGRRRHRRRSRRPHGRRGGPERIRDLLAYGVPFDRDLEGHFVLSREAAHSAKRIVRVSGDRAGAAIMQALDRHRARHAVDPRSSSTTTPRTSSSTDGRVTGVRLIRSEARGNGTFDLLPASAVVLATGGIGRLYAVTTNPAYARGEAMAFAARAGAVIADAEFVQFHPTAIDIGADPGAARDRSRCAAKARSWSTATASASCTACIPRPSLPRATSSPAACSPRSRPDAAPSSIAAAPSARSFPTAFPTVYGFCMDAGIDPTTELIPVAPAAHYHMGGIATDLRGRTTVEGLWAAGEVASTGLHGANRLASNSLLEAVVFGARVATDIKALVSQRAAPRRSPRPIASTMTGRATRSGAPRSSPVCAGP